MPSTLQVPWAARSLSPFGDPTLHLSCGQLGCTGLTSAPAPCRSPGQLDSTGPSRALTSHCCCGSLGSTGLCGALGPTAGGWGVLLPRGAQLLLSLCCSSWGLVSAAGLCFCFLGMDVCSPTSVAGGISLL
uniref:Uncharacterized protein n=1 Tax=Molossus molossus TaxID=27622 RepID=A0A7J8FS61_MOLMO|nr:hypothetical protein HJG59_008406 [Molossus molossus]